MVVPHPLSGSLRAGGRLRVSKATLLRSRYARLLPRLLLAVLLIASPIGAQNTAGPELLSEGRAAYDRGDLVAAERLLSQSETHGEPEKERDLWLGRVEQALGHLPRAEALLRRYAERHAEDAEGWYALGQVQFREAKAKESLQALERGGHLRAPTALEDRIGGADYVLLKDYPLAITLFERSLRLDPADRLTRYYLGRALYSNNNFNDAIRAFESVLQAEPHQLRAEDNLALSLAGAGRMQEAEAEFRSALTDNEKAPVTQVFPYADFANFLVENARSAEARRYLTTAVQLPAGGTDHGDLARAERLLGQVFLTQGDGEQAVAHLRRSIELFPDDSGTHFLLGRAYKLTGDKVSAGTEFQTVQRLAQTSSNNP